MRHFHAKRARLSSAAVTIACAVGGIAQAQDYSALANAAMADPAHYSPVIFVIRDDGGGRPQQRDGKYGWVGCATDDPWMHPFVDVFRGADGGFDVICTVDPAAPVPGQGEIDAHVGSPDPFHPFQEDDTPGDLFLLGDWRNPFYAGKTNASDVEVDFVYLHRFDADAARIRLHGVPEDYILAPAANQETGQSGTAIFLTARGTDDLIAFVEGVAPEQVPLDGPTFIYATQPGGEPILTNGTQMGNGGINTFGRIAIAPDGHIFQVFLSSGPDLAGLEPGDTGSFYLAKFTPDGQRVWLRKHGVVPDATNRGEMPFNIIATDQYVFVSGHTKGAFGGPAPTPTENSGTIAIVVKFDAKDGELLQIKRLNDDTENANVWSLAADSTGQFLYICGGTSDNGVPITPHTSPYVAQLRQIDLVEQWRDVIVDGNGLDPRGPYYAQVSNEAIARMTYVEDDMGVGSVFISGYATAGNFLGGQAGVCNAWAARYSTSGARLWAHAFSSPTGNQYPWGTAADADGNFYVVGQTYGAMGGDTAWGLGDGFIRKFDPDGNSVWTRLIGTDASDDLHSIEIIDGILYVAGSTWGNLADLNRGYADGYVASLDTDGNLLGTWQFGTEAIDYLRDARMNGNEMVISGITEGSLADAASGGFDVFLSRVDPMILAPLSNTRIEVADDLVRIGWRIDRSPAQGTIFGSEDLDEWEELGSAESRNFFFYYQEVPSYPRRFYRLEWQASSQDVP